MDRQSDRCLHCGATLTGGLFCTRCGARVGTDLTDPQVWSSPTDTAERVYEIPEPAYAAPSAPPGGPAYSPEREPSHLAPGRVARPSPGPGLWIGAAVALVLMLVLGGFLLLRGAGDSGAASPTAPHASGTLGSSAGTDAASSPTGSASSSASTVTGPPTNVAGLAQAASPAHAPAGVDFAGRPVTYVAANMVDGRKATCWRTPGDATGMVLTFRLDQPTLITRVGLVNGYSKIAYDGGQPTDWYLENRRVLAVDWVFGDGSTVPQRFHNDRAMQKIAVPPVTTSVVRLRITAVSAPGNGPSARNDTAISEVLLVGRSG
jgi:hypothetical protein